MRDTPRISVCVTSLGVNPQEAKAISSAINKLRVCFPVSIWNQLEATDMFGSQSVGERVGFHLTITGLTPSTSAVR